MRIQHYIQKETKVQDTPWFAVLTNEQQNKLLECSNVIAYNQGETIVKQGFMASYIMFLEQGVVKLNVENRGLVTTFKLANGGNFIGLMCSFVNKILDFSAVAATSSSIFLINRDLFESLIKENGDFAVYIVKLMSELTNGVVHNLINLSHKNVNGAVATLLLDFIEIFNNDRFALPLNRTEMAAALGYSKESIINTLSDFQRDGIIMISGKQIDVIDRQLLISVSKNG